MKQSAEMNEMTISGARASYSAAVGSGVSGTI